jgi:DNA-binding NtrC family response regulator
MHTLLTAFSDMLQRRKLVKPAIIALLGSETDRQVVSDFCLHNECDVLFAGTCAETRTLMARVKAQILFMDRDLAESDWKESMADFASFSGVICIVLVSRVVDGNLWNEVVRNGGYEVLAKPLREDDVVRAVRLAWSYTAAHVRK